MAPQTTKSNANVASFQRAFFKYGRKKVSVDTSEGATSRPGPGTGALLAGGFMDIPIGACPDACPTPGFGGAGVHH